MVGLTVAQLVPAGQIADTRPGEHGTRRVRLVKDVAPDQLAADHEAQPAAAGAVPGVVHHRYLNARLVQDPPRPVAAIQRVGDSLRMANPAKFSRRRGCPPSSKPSPVTRRHRPKLLPFRFDNASDAINQYGYSIGPDRALDQLS